jgi:beta-hydroxylase
MHMGLIIPDPEKCHINVEGDKYHWQNGKVVLFDDTYNHYAVNETDELRVILFIDYMRPMRFPYNLINSTVMKISWAFPYIWRPLLRHRRWSRKFYGYKLPVT